jgi:hypothetical protein
MALAINMKAVLSGWTPPVEQSFRNVLSEFNKDALFSVVGDTRCPQTFLGQYPSRKNAQISAENR